MADNFFKHFPIVRYGNTFSVNLLSKVQFQKDNDLSYYIYHPYIIKEGERADTIANFYYGDPGFDWLVYYSNQVVDPYFDWPMDTNTFREFIDKKYGSVSTAQSKVKHYKSNYFNDFSLISIAAYNALSEIQKPFWTPVLSQDLRIIQYERKKEDKTFSTNQVLSLSITANSTTSFITEELVTQKNGGIVVASGTLNYSNSSVAVVSSTSGSFSNSYPLVGSSSQANVAVTSVSVLSTTIPSALVNYFEPISYYDYEEAKNEQRKHIRLLDVAYASEASKRFKELLSS